MSGNGHAVCGVSIPTHRSAIARSKREDLQAPAEESRVLRGGAFWDDHQYVRCAYRVGYGARGVYNALAFAWRWRVPHDFVLWSLSL